MRTILGLALLVSAAHADEVLLKSGGRVEGIVRKDGDKVIVETFAGETTIAMSDVASIDEKHKSKLEEYYERAAAIKSSKEAKDFVELAVWARQQKGNRLIGPNLERAIAFGKELKDARAILSICATARDGGIGAEMRPLWERVLELEPDNETARRGLGHHRHNNQWLTEDEYQTAIGNVKFEGKWISAAERDAVLKERALKLEERAKAVEAREKSLAEIQAALERASKKLEEARREIEKEKKSVDEREERVKTLERTFAAYLYCKDCDTYYKATHLCSKIWIWCKTCEGYFKLGHKCPKK